MILKIFIVLILFLILYKIVENKKRENFQIEYIRKINNKLDYAINKTKKKGKKTKYSSNTEYIDPSKKYLYNNKIVITGGTSGIGYEIAKMLNKYKPFLVICGRKKNKVQNIVKDFKKLNPNVYGIWVDLSKPNGGKKIYDEIKKNISSVDILINNAIINKGSRFLLSKDYKDWENEISVNINGNIVLTQKIANLMKIRKIQGRIINITSNSSKATTTSLNSGSEILTQNMIEKYSNLLADELYSLKIAVTTVRINEDYKETKSYFNSDSKLFKKYFGDVFGVDLNKLMPIFLYAIKAPFHEISGKIISSDSFKQNIELSKIIPSHQMKLNTIYKDFAFNKFTKDKNKIYLVKQNPYNMSPNVSKIINKNIVKKINNEAKYVPILDSVIAKNLGINKKNIVFYKTEYDCIKKLVEIFVPKYQSIIVVNPMWTMLKLVGLEYKIDIEYSILNRYGKQLKPDYNIIKNYINSKTKMIYLSSPNITSGQSLDKDDFINFMEQVPENIVVLVDQRYLEFSTKKDVFKGHKLIKDYKNLIVLRSFNNYYSMENLEICYTITNKKVSKFISENIIVNQLDNFNEQIALEVYKDKYYKEIKHKIAKERNRVIEHFKKNKIDYFLSETNFLLVKVSKDKEDVSEELDKRNIILYKSNDNYNNFWTLPLSTKNINDTIIDVLIYNNL